MASLEINEKLENLSKEIDVMKKYQMEIIDRKNTVIKIKKNVSDGLDSGLKMSGNRTSELEDRSIESIQSEQQRNRLKKKVQLFRDPLGQ